MWEFNEEAISNDVDLINNIPDDKINEILQLIKNSTGNFGIELHKIQENVEKIFDQKHDEIHSLLSLIYSVSKISDDGLLEEYIGFIREKFPNNKKILDIIQKISELNIIDDVIKFDEYIDLKNFGLPHMSSLGLVVDYRILDFKKKEVIPIVICNLIIHNVEDKDKTKHTSRNIVFQITPENLKDMVKTLQTISEKIEKEISMISIREDP